MNSNRDFSLKSHFTKILLLFCPKKRDTAYMLFQTLSTQGLNLLQK